MNKPDQKSSSSQQGSSIPRSRVFGVGASPFNMVKFDLGVLLCLGILLWILVDRLSNDINVQLMILAGYGLASMLWIIFHTRRVLHRLTSASNSGADSDN